MILKGYIKELPELGNNVYKVRIPYLEDNTGHEMIFDALQCNQPGLFGGYNVGDCVYLEFEGYKYKDPTNPVIIGRLYVDKETGCSTTQEVYNLTVSNKITLPANTKIGGYGMEDFFKLCQRAEANIGFDFVVTDIITPDEVIV